MQPGSNSRNGAHAQPVVTIRLGRDERERLDALAEARGTTRSWLIRTLVRMALAGDATQPEGTP